MKCINKNLKSSHSGGLTKMNKLYYKSSFNINKTIARVFTQIGWIEKRKGKNAGIFDFSLKINHDL